MNDAPTNLPMKGRPQPSRSDVSSSKRLMILSHPLASNLVTKLRDNDTPIGEFESSIHELTRQLLWQATSHEPLEAVEVSSFSGKSVSGSRFRRHMAAMVILRAGLSMIPPFKLLVPNSPIFQIGIKRNETTLEPNMYYSNLPVDFSAFDHVIVLDPMLATGGSAGLAVKQIRANFDGDISFLGLIGAPLGVSTLLDADSRVSIYLASLDDKLDDRGYIVPGLGDAGDRLFGTN